MGDIERRRQQTAERMRRMRARRAEEAERARQWAVRLADRLEREHPEAARVLADVPAHVAGAMVEELNRRRFERAEARAAGMEKPAPADQGGP